MNEETIKATVCWFGTRVKATSWKVYVLRLVMALMNVPEQAITWNRVERKVL